MTKLQIPIKENLIEISESTFSFLLSACRPPRSMLSGFAGPFIDSLPAGNVFSEPFRQMAWIAEKKAILLKYENFREKKTSYYADRDVVDQIVDGPDSGVI